MDRHSLKAIAEGLHQLLHAVAEGQKEGHRVAGTLERPPQEPLPEASLTLLQPIEKRQSAGHAQATDVAAVDGRNQGLRDPAGELLAQASMEKVLDTGVLPGSWDPRFQQGSYLTRGTQ